MIKEKNIETKTQRIVKIVVYVVNSILILGLIYWNWVIRYVLAWGVTHHGWIGYYDPFYLWNISLFYILPAVIFGFTTGFVIINQKERIISACIYSILIVLVQSYFAILFTGIGYTNGAPISDFIPIIIGPIVFGVLFVVFYFLSRLLSKKTWEKPKLSHTSIQ